MTANDQAAIEPWLSQINWELRYDTCDPHASQVITKMIELGFTVLAPPLPPFSVTYNGVPVFRGYLREQAEEFIRQLGSKPGYEIREENT